jgi:hypothetical protein
MKVNCPYCRKEINFMEMQGDKDLIAINMMSAGFGKHAHLVWAYVELFSVTPMRGKIKKIRVILEEMKGLFDSQAFKYQKRKYEISQAGISEALNVVVHRHFETPLDSHNYLKKIMIGISEREGRESGKQAERGLRKKEDRMRYPVREEQVEASESQNAKGKRQNNEPELPPEQIAENMKRLKEVVGSVFSKDMEPGGFVKGVGHEDK